MCGAESTYVKSGTYVGNGVDGRPITGLGFQPDVVLVKSEGDEIATLRTATMPAGRSKEMIDASALAANEIASLDPDGFTVGSAAEVNREGVAYYWVAFKAGGNLMRVGSYTGNAINGLSISGIGFQPELVFVLPDASYDAVLPHI